MRVSSVVEWIPEADPARMDPGGQGVHPESGDVPRCALPQTDYATEEPERGPGATHLALAASPASVGCTLAPTAVLVRS